MNILPGIETKLVKEQGTDLQKTIVEYFDKNGNGILEASEVGSLHKAKVEKTDNGIKITNSDGQVDTFENMSIKHSDQYYKSGTIPVAVIDMFDETYDNGWHGKHVCNIMKSVNPDISITKFDNSPSRASNKLQKMTRSFLTQHKKIDKFASTHEPFKSLINKIFNAEQVSAIEMCLDDIIKQKENGIGYSAINMSCSCDCTYPEINRLVSKELGDEVTPDNLAKYKKQIKEILETKRNKKFNSEGDKVKISQTLDIIHKMESLKIPVYIAASYQSKNDGQEAFNIWALANNAKSVEAGKEQENGEMKTSSHVSSNSLSLDENGKRRVENSIYYSNDSYKSADSKELADEISGVSTSMATPIALAKAFMQTRYIV